jgi:hypothetical protein
VTKKKAVAGSKSRKAATSTKARKAPAKKKSTSKGKRQPATATSESSARDVVTIDRRRKAGRRQKQTPVATERRQLQRRAKVNRRRQIDPTTCERDYTQDELEFMHAIDEYKRSSGRMFPTCSEVLEVLVNLGYQKVSAGDKASEATDGRPASPCPTEPQSAELAARPELESVEA